MGLWRANAEAQRREVIVSFGKSTLVLADGAGRALTHWSLPAIERVNPGQTPALFTPELGGTETLELSDETMIAALERVRTAVERTKPRPGRLRQVGVLASFATVVALAFFWLPGTLVTYTVKVVPPLTRTEIGTALATQMRRLTGSPCADGFGLQALIGLSDRLWGPRNETQILIVPDGLQGAVALPGGIIVAGRELVEDHEDPMVLAAHLVAATEAARANDPLRRILDDLGLRATIGLLTSGQLREDKLSDYAESLISNPPQRPGDATLIAAFRAAGVRATPFAYAIDISGEKTLGLIEADPFARPASPPPPLLSDGAWVSLQGICGP